jgi:hypothetical protein
MRTTGSYNACINPFQLSKFCVQNLSLDAINLRKHPSDETLLCSLLHCIFLCVCDTFSSHPMRTADWCISERRAFSFNRKRQDKLLTFHYDGTISATTDAATTAATTNATVASDSAGIAADTTTSEGDNSSAESIATAKQKAANVIGSWWFDVGGLFWELQESEDKNAPSLHYRAEVSIQQISPNDYLPCYWQTIQHTSY